MLKGLDGNKVNEVSNAVIELLQGQGGALSAVAFQHQHVHHATWPPATSSSAMSSTISTRCSRRSTIRAPSSTPAVDQLQQLITGLAQGTDPIAGAIGPLASAESDLTDMLANGRRPLQGVIENLRPLADERSTTVRPT